MRSVLFTSCSPTTSTPPRSTRPSLLDLTARAAIFQPAVAAPAVQLTDQWEPQGEQIQ